MLPKNWAQVNEDGFGYPPGNGGRLFTFGGRLFASTDHGTFRMDSLMCARWRKVYTPGPECIPFDTHLYCVDIATGSMWLIDQGSDFDTLTSWQKVVSNGVPGGAHPWPMAVFGGQVYGALYPTGSQTFDIWRSGDIGKTQMMWTKVVPNAFGDPANNQWLSFMGTFNGKLYAGTNSLIGNFGDKQTAAGVEVWESPTGDTGSWKQVNKSGFGTEIPEPFGGAGTMRTNHVIGSWAVDRPPKQTKDYLYVGTSSHWGGEIWRYDGTGSGGWTTLLSSVDPNFGQPTRNNAMVPYKDSLYVAQGFPTGDLLRYDGAKWYVVESGPNPFHAENGGISDLAVHVGTLYALTLHKPYSGSTKGDQVYAHPFHPVAAFACKPRSLLSTWKALFEIAKGRLALVTPSSARAGVGAGRELLDPEIEEHGRRTQGD